MQPMYIDCAEWTDLCILEGRKGHWSCDTLTLSCDTDLNVVIKG